MADAVIVTKLFLQVRESQKNRSDKTIERLLKLTEVCLWIWKCADEFFTSVAVIHFFPHVVLLEKIYSDFMDWSIITMIYWQQKNTTSCLIVAPSGNGFFFFFLRAYTWINLFRNSIRYTEQESSWIRQVCDVVSSRNIHWWFRQLYACIIYPVIIREPFRMVSSAILCAKSCPSPRWRVGGNEKISTYNPVLLKYVISRGLITSHNSLNAC